MVAYYQRLRFYIFLLKKTADQPLSDFEDYNDISPSSITRWKRAFESELFVEIISTIIQDQDVRSRIMKAIQDVALSGNLAAAKFILEENQIKPETELFTIDEALKMIQEAISGK